MPADPQQLPPLPSSLPYVLVRLFEGESLEAAKGDYFNAEQMRAYAAEAVASALAAAGLSAQLTQEEAEFVELVKHHPGGKLNDGKAWGANGESLWTRPEKLGIITSVGSYKWKLARPWPARLDVPLVAPNSPEIPDVWKLVPVEMTARMLSELQVKTEIGSYIAANWSGAYACFDEFWRVALAAAPSHEPEGSAFLKSCATPQTNDGPMVERLRGIARDAVQGGGVKDGSTTQGETDA